MHSDRVVLDRESFKALASDTRISILKALFDRRMTLTQLSESLGLSKPALLKHMDALVAASLVKKEERERKWVYYDLTFKGKNIVHPERVAVTIMLATSIISFFGAVYAFAVSFLSSSASGSGRPFPTGEGLGYDQGTSSAQTFAASTDAALLIGMVLLAVFIVLMVAAVYLKSKHSKPSI